MIAMCHRMKKMKRTSRFSVSRLRLSFDEGQLMALRRVRWTDAGGGIAVKAAGRADDRYRRVVSHIYL